MGHYHKINSGYQTLVDTKPDGTHGITLLVGGAYCAACIEKIESAARKQAGVTNARLNFSSGKFIADWDGDIEVANDIAENIEALGYKVSPYEIDKKQTALLEEEKFLLLCMGVAGFAMGNIMLLSVGLWSTNSETMGYITRDFLHWVSALIALPTIIFSGRPFYRSAYAAVKAGHTNMDVPITVGLFLAGFLSTIETFTHGEDAYFDSAVMLIFFLLLGRYFDFRARKKARTSASNLLDSLSGFVNVIEDGIIRNVLIKNLLQGDHVIVPVGESFPANGIIINGTSEVDFSIATGETLPVAVKPGDTVYAGTVNISSPLTMKVSAPAEKSLVAEISALMEKASQSQSKYVRIADRLARLYTPVIHATAFAAGIFWYLFMGAGLHHSVVIAITVLIITCPCALGLAVPVVQVLATDRLMKKGVLVKSGDAMERLSKIDMILFDKTGTITMGKPVLVHMDNPDILPVAAALAMQSSHPLSKAIVSFYKGKIAAAENIKEYPGQGLEGTVEGRAVRLGKAEWCGTMRHESSADLRLYCSVDGRAPAVFVFKDEIKKDARALMSRFDGIGIQTALLTGDREEVARAVAQECGISSWSSHLSPEDKFLYMQKLKNAGRTILMVGDGLNDAPSLAGADISMAPGTAIGISQNAADVVFMGDGLMPVFETYMTACKAEKLVRQNFGMAIIYNIFAIPLAAMGLINPLIAALAMSGSSLVVILNSFRMKL